MVGAPGGVTRRGLLAAGAGAGLALAGCGAEDDAPPPDAELLAPSLAVTVALASAYERVGGGLGAELAARERGHAERLRRAGAAGGARAPVASGGSPLEAVLALEQAAMRAHVHAAGLVRAPAARALAADLLADAARHAVRLRAQLGRPELTTAFPDGRDGA